MQSSSGIKLRCVFILFFDFFFIYFYIQQNHINQVLNLEREQISRTKAEQISGREHKKETQTLCESLDNREGKIQHLQMNFVDISEQLQHQIQQVGFFFFFFFFFFFVCVSLLFFEN